jgi:hypothetical protein
VKRQPTKTTAAGKPAAVVDPGRKATPEEARKANAEAFALLAAIEPLNLPKAAERIRANPPSAEAVAMLASLYQRLLQRARASKPRAGSLRQALRDAGVTRYTDVKTKAPELLKAYTKRQLTEAIAKAKQKKLP